MEQNICIQLQLYCINFYTEFHARSTNMPISLNGTKDMYIVHMTFYKALCLDMGISQRFGNACIFV
jgi:hypothetical protein